ncbi:MAG: hypothetical protein ACKVWR_07450 [Acidimicrobiales bacterium]
MPASIAANGASAPDSTKLCPRRISLGVSPAVSDQRAGQAARSTLSPAGPVSVLSFTPQLRESAGPAAAALAAPAALVVAPAASVLSPSLPQAAAARPIPAALQAQRRSHARLMQLTPVLDVPSGRTKDPRPLL